MKYQYSLDSKNALSITIMEPAWDGPTHLPGNIGLMRVVSGAYPDSTVSYVGGKQQIELLKEMAPPDELKRVSFSQWLPYLDKDTLPTDVFASLQRLRKLPVELTTNADLIVMCSATATMLSAINLSKLASRTCAMLHGNANELAGWRSRNLFRSLFDLTGALKCFCRQGGRVMVLEDRIRNQMASQYPWLASSLSVVPHPLLPEEAGTPGLHRQLTIPIRIGFAGRASIAKGFPDFLEFAHQLHKLRPDTYEFHAFGTLAEECLGLDQSALMTQAKGTLSRENYLAGLNSLHYIFAWHQDNYYGNAASGIIYDAVNLGIPMIARHCTQLLEWTAQGLNIANSFDDLNVAVRFMVELELTEETAHYNNQCVDLDKIRESLSMSKLSNIFRENFPLT